MRGLVLRTATCNALSSALECPSLSFTMHCTSIAQKSCSVLSELGPQVQWVQSYVTDDKIYCIYIAPNKEIQQGDGA